MGMLREILVNKSVEEKLLFFPEAYKSSSQQPKQI